LKTIKFIGYLLYRYYSKRQSDSVAYFGTLCSMTLLGSIHLMQILVLINKISLIPGSPSDDQFTTRVIAFLLMLPVYLLMTRLFRKKDIEPLEEKYDKDWDKVFSGYVWLVIYIVLSFTLGFGLAIWRKHQA